MNEIKTGKFIAKIAGNISKIAILEVTSTSFKVQYESGYVQWYELNNHPFVILEDVSLLNEGPGKRMLYD